MAKDKKRHYGSARENAESRASGASYSQFNRKGIPMFSPEADTTAIIDILPYEVTDKNHMDKIKPGTLWYKKPYRIHKRVGAGNGEDMVCPNSVGKPCPICEQRDELYSQNADKKVIAKTKSSLRNVYAVKVREYDGKKKFDKDAIHLFDFSDYLFQEPFEKQLKKKDRFDNFFSHDEGCSLELTFDEESFEKSKYPVVTRVEFVERKKQYKESILDEVPNLDEVLIVPTYEELEEKFFIESGVADTEPDDTESKKDKKKKKKSKDDTPEQHEEEKRSEKYNKFKEDKKSDKKEKKNKNKKKKEEPTLSEVVESTESVEDLLSIAKENAGTFGLFKKELKKIEKPKKLKARMLEIIEESQELPFNDTADKSEEGEKSKGKKGKKKDKEKCPYNHKFGVDTDSYDDCSDCDLWNECKAAKKAAKKNK